MANARLRRSLIALFVATLGASACIVHDDGAPSLSGPSEAVGGVVAPAGFPPTAEFAFSPTSPFAGQSVFVNGNLSTAPLGHSIASYTWTWGDGTTTTGVTSSHAYSVPGTFTIVLTVTDSVGTRTTVSKTVSVTAATPTAKLTLIKTGTTASFIADGSGSTAVTGLNITNYRFVLDAGAQVKDGSASVVTFEGLAAPVAPATTTTHSVQLTVTDELGHSATTSANLTLP